MAKTDPSEAVTAAAPESAGERAAGAQDVVAEAPPSPADPADGGAASAAGEPDGAEAAAGETPSQASLPNVDTSAQADASAVKQPGAGGAQDEDVRDDIYRVKVEGFEGPLDLLLHLIRKHELDILDIPISFITSKYLQYLELMKSLQIDVASEYLVMAATLAWIKSKTLLPPDPSEEGEEEELEEIDPRQELVRRLLEYQKYKGAAADFRHRATLAMDTFGRGTSEPVPEGPAPLAPVSMFRLFDAFQKVLKRTDQSTDHQVLFEKMSITERVVELTELLHKRRRMRFEQLFLRPDPSQLYSAPSRADLILTFLALLEMCKMRIARVIQEDSLGELSVVLASKHLGPGDEVHLDQDELGSADEAELSAAADGADVEESSAAADGADGSVEEPSSAADEADGSVEESSAAADEVEELSAAAEADVEEPIVVEEMAGDVSAGARRLRVAAHLHFRDGIAMAARQVFRRAAHQLLRQELQTSVPEPASPTAPAAPAVSPAAAETPAPAEPAATALQQNFRRAAHLRLQSLTPPAAELPPTELPPVELPSTELPPAEPLPEELPEPAAPRAGASPAQAQFRRAARTRLRHSALLAARRVFRGAAHTQLSAAHAATVLMTTASNATVPAAPDLP